MLGNFTDGLSRGLELKIRERQLGVVSSALWAAAGDALGWITELADEDTVAYRSGSRRVESTVDWKRRIGGRFGVTVPLPAGTYSDDTQLRLSVCRSIRGDGEFDVVAFAKVELPVWLSYSLGGGRGTTAAAANLSKSSVTWFSNFFSSRDSRDYFAAGGNGAAMRIQPHVWKSASLRFEEYALDILRDAITTHGHPTGFCGALFHGMCVAHALASGEIPGPQEWTRFIDQFGHVAELVSQDEQLGLFWVGPWQERFGADLQKAVDQEAKRAISSLQKASKLVSSGPGKYAELVECLGGFAETTRGSGTNTAIIAAAAAYLGTQTSAVEAIQLCANTIGSDTDTIGSMAGAILGAALGGEPKWKVQDREYIVAEAARLADIAAGKPASSFHYPDLMKWSPPTTQGDAVGTRENSYFIAGLGRAEPVGEVWTNSEAEWQWLRLEFGQTVLAKRRPRPRELDAADLPIQQPPETTWSSSDEPSLFSVSHQSKDKRKGVGRRESSRASEHRSHSSDQPVKSLDELSDWVIRENFEPEVVGRALLNAAQGSNPVERAAALAAIIAKAIDARRRRSGR